MTEVEQLLQSALQRLQDDYELRFTELNRELLALAELVQTPATTEQRGPATRQLAEGIATHKGPCANCRHAAWRLAKGKNNGLVTRFECLLIRTDTPALDCTKHEPVV